MPRIRRVTSPERRPVIFFWENDRNRGNQCNDLSIEVEMNEGSKVMGKTVVSAFAFAILVILSASAFAPRSVAHTSEGCTPAYGVDPCAVLAIAE